MTFYIYFRILFLAIFYKQSKIDFAELLRLHVQGHPSFNFTKYVIAPKNITDIPYDLKRIYLLQRDQLNSVPNMQANPEPNEKDLKLELVQVIPLINIQLKVFRHGARTPIPEEFNVFHFNDLSSYQAWGLGQLTDIGMKLEYDIGLFLRERYKDFLNEHYKSDELYAYSSDINRTKMSLQLVLAGLYPPKDHAVWNPNLIWAPIPYAQVPAELDVLIKCYDFPRSKQLRNLAYQSEEFVKKRVDHSDFLAFLIEQTKVDLDVDFFNLAFLYGTIVADERMNLPMPDWYKPEMKEKFQELVSLAFDGYAFTPELRKLGTGLLIKKIIENMNLNGANVNPRKMYLYSAHDCNVALFTRSHEIEDFRYPDFGCSLILEKLRDSNNKVYVRLLGRTGYGNVTTLKLGNHKEFCPIEDYLKLVEPVVPSESEVDEMFGEVSITRLKSLFYNDAVVKQLQN